MGKEQKDLVFKQISKIDLDLTVLPEPDAEAISSVGEIAGEDTTYGKAERDEMQHKIKGLLNKLPERDRNIMELRMEGKSYSEIANEFNVTEARIGQIIQRSLSALHNQATGKGFSDYIGAKDWKDFPILRKRKNRG